MQRLLCSILLAGAVLASGCSTDTASGCCTDVTTTPQAISEPLTMAGAIAQACSLLGRQALALSGFCTIRSLERRELGAQIVEYAAAVQIGPDEVRDVIGLHRVVKEAAPWEPIVAIDSLFMVHGDAWPFRGAFLDAPDGDTVAERLAENDIDVWGIDLRWTRVPAATQDFAFMRDWGLETDGFDLEIALSVARATRFYTGSGFARLLLLGWSRGGQLGYTYIGAETTRPAPERHVSGFVAADVYLKVPPGDAKRAQACERIHDPARGNLAAHNAGIYANPGGGILSAIGSLAITQPSAQNPFFPSGHPFAAFTNRQAALASGSQTHALLFHPPVPLYHFVGGSFDTTGAPTGLRHVASEDRWFRALQGAAPFEPLQVLLDADAIICDDGSSRLDRHLAEIRIPVLYLGAAGAFGAAGLHTLTLIASTDKTALVRTATPGDLLGDLGHFDLWLAEDAARLWWNPLARWVQAHRPGP